MRKVVMGMMTTLNGRLDDPDAWVTGIPDDLYAELDRLYGTFDTILVGRTTYEESSRIGQAPRQPRTAETSKSMASKMNSYKKYVFTGASEKTALEWNNAEQVLAHSDKDIVAFVNGLKTQSGGDIHLSGGARLAETSSASGWLTSTTSSCTRSCRLARAGSTRSEERDEVAERHRLLERRRRSVLRPPGRLIRGRETDDRDGAGVHGHPREAARPPPL